MVRVIARQVQAMGGQVKGRASFLASQTGAPAKKLCIPQAEKRSEILYDLGSYAFFHVVAGTDGDAAIVVGNMQATAHVNLRLHHPDEVNSFWGKLSLVGWNCAGAFQGRGILTF